MVLPVPSPQDLVLLARLVEVVHRPGGGADRVCAQAVPGGAQGGDYGRVGQGRLGGVGRKLRRVGSLVVEGN